MAQDASYDSSSETVASPGTGLSTGSSIDGSDRADRVAGTRSGHAVGAPTSPGTAEIASDLRRRVIALSGPALVEMFLMSLIGMADMIMVGRMGSQGPAAIAAVGLTNQPMFFIQAAFMALNVGATAIVARSIGARDRATACNATRQTLIVTIVMGLMTSLLGILISHSVIVLMGAEEEVIPLGTLYMQIVSAGMIFATITMAISAALRGAGDTKTPMKVNVTANIVNVIGNYLLIYGNFGFPRLGIAGAAIATSFSRFVACIMVLRVIYSGHFILHLSLKDSYRPDFPLIKRILRVGVPAAIEQFILRGGQLVFVRVVSSFGTVVFAAHQIGMNIQSLSFTPGQAFSIAATTLVGQGLGAKKTALAEKGAMEARRLGMIVSGCTALMFIFFSRQIASLYTSDPAVISRSAMVLKILALVQPAQSTQFILAGGLRGAGDTKWPLYSTFIGIWVVRVALGYFFAVVLNLELLGAWMAMAMDQLARAAIIYARFKAGKWKRVAV